MRWTKKVAKAWNVVGGWRMKSKCADCPFAKSGPGAHLRSTLHPTFWQETLDNLKRGGHFFCHKTTTQTGDGSWRLCAGALEWQVENNGQVGDAAQAIERIEAARRAR